jgi:hypothetical protein
MVHGGNEKRNGCSVEGYLYVFRWWGGRNNWSLRERTVLLK